MYYVLCELCQADMWLTCTDELQIVFEISKDIEKRHHIFDCVLFMQRSL